MARESVPRAGGLGWLANPRMLVGLSAFLSGGAGGGELRRAHRKGRFVRPLWAPERSVRTGGIYLAGPAPAPATAPRVDSGAS